MKMFKVLILSVFFLSCTTTWKTNPQRIIYTNQNVQLIGKDAGLPVYINSIDLTISNFISYEREFLTPFSLKLNYYFESYGLKVENNDISKSNNASLFVNILSLNTKETVEITNIFNLLYTLEISFSLLEKNIYLQKDKTIKEYVLVFDTNRYNYESVLNYMADISARHIAERVKFGWQSDYSKTDNKILILGGPVETNNRTNRSKWSS